MAKNLVQLVKTYRKRTLLLSLLKNGVMVLAASVALIAVVLTLEFLGRFESNARTLFFWLGVLGIMVLWFSQVFVRLFRMLRPVSHNELVNWAKRLEPVFGDGAAVALELNTEKGSLSAMAVKDIEKRWSSVQLERAIDWRFYKRFFASWFGVAFIFIVGSFTLPSSFWDAGHRVLNYSEARADFAPFSFNVHQFDAEVFEFENVQVKLDVLGNEVPEDVYVVFGNSKRRMARNADGVFSYEFSKLSENLDFSFEAAGFASSNYSIEVVKMPVLKGVDVEITYPDYLGIKPLNTSVGKSMDIPQGSVLNFKFHVEHQRSKPLLLTEGLTLDESNVSIDSNMHLSYETGIESERIVLKDFNLNCVMDEFPKILGLNDALTESVYSGSIEYSDDYGFSRVEVVLLVEGVQRAWWNVDFNQDLASQSSSFVVDYREELKQGEDGELFIVISDSDKPNGFKKTCSQRRYVQRLSMEEVEKKALVSMSDSVEKLDQAKKELVKLNKQRKELKTKKSTGELSNRELKEQMNAIDQAIEQLQKEVDNLLKDLKRETKQVDFEEKDELEERLDELIDPELEEKLQELERLQDSLGIEPKEKKSLDQLELDKLEDQLDRTLEMLKRLEVEKEMEKLLEDFEKLAEKQEELSKKDDDVSEDQKELNEKVEELKEKLEEINDKNNKLESPQYIPKEEDLSSSDQDRNDAEDSLGNGKSKKANKSQKSAAEKMKQEAQNAKSMMQSAQESRQDEDVAQLRLIRKRLVDYSVNQEGLMESMKMLKASDVSYTSFVKNQELMNREMKVIEDSLIALSKRNVQIEGMVVSELRNWEYARNGAIEFHVERKRAQGVERQQGAMMSANRLALMLDESIKQMQKQQQQNMQGAAACKKPGGKNSQQMKSSSEKQGELNKQMEKLKKSLEKEGGKPEGGKKAGGSEGGSESFSRAAMEQKRLRESLRKMMDEMGSGTDGLSQNLKRMMQDMEKVEDDLINKRLTQETLKRQQDILQRMLESEKAMRQQEEDEERESTTGEDLNDDLSNELLEKYLKERERELELLKKEPVELKKYYKNALNGYYNSTGNER